MYNLEKNEKSMKINNKEQLMEEMSQFCFGKNIILLCRRKHKIV
jgi:hypothetical protein